MKKIMSFMLMFLLTFAVVSGISDIGVEEVDASSRVTSLVSGKFYVIKSGYRGTASDFSDGGYFWNRGTPGENPAYLAVLNRAGLSQGKNNIFKLVKTGDYWYIIPIDRWDTYDGARTGISGGSSADGTALKAYSPNDNQTQKFKITHLGNGKFNIKTGANGYSQSVIAVNNGTTSFNVVQMKISSAAETSSLNYWEFIAI